MWRRQLIASVLMMIVFTVVCGLIYPLAVWGVGQLAFSHNANGSLIYHNGEVVGSSLIGQTFADKNGNPDLRYFQPRPSAAGAGYDANASSASNLGPGDPRLIGKCLPVPATDTNGNTKVDSHGNEIDEKKPDGSLVCNPNTVPQRALAYRNNYHLPTTTKIPVDAVTASASGLDPEISVANALLQAPVVALNRHMSLTEIDRLIHKYTMNRILGFLGEKGVNVLKLNLALDSVRHR